MNELASLWRTARTLGARRRAGKPLPPLLFFTDPWRTPHPQRQMALLPPGAGVVFRHFGRGALVARAGELAALARRRRLTFLVGADVALALKVRADGVHLPERRAGAVRIARRLRPGWIVTAAAHSEPALVRARRAGADAAVLSPAFLSRSPSAGRALGPIRFAGLVRRAGLPVYALGGIDARTARRLQGSGAVGFAAVDAIRT